MTTLIDTTEMYLRTIWELLEERVTPLRARIVERLQQSGPTVSQTVSRMERDGLLRVIEDRHILLSELGESLATEVMRRHRLAERLLFDVIGLDWSLLHEEACKWEHVIGEAVEDKLFVLLDQPTVSPYGMPIPGVGVTLAEAAAECWRGVSLLSTLLARQEPGRSVTVARIGELLQRDRATLEALSAAGVRPGRMVEADQDERRLTLRCEGTCHLDVAWGDHIFVRA